MANPWASNSNHSPPSYNVPRRSPNYGLPTANCTGNNPLSPTVVDSPMAGNNTNKRPFYSAFDGASSDHEMVEDDAGECILLQPGEKRARRLTVEQVRALEKAFDVDNKLEPERKVQLANQLALQERQVAVWFQNRRARWKTKQMERDFHSLKKKMELLKSDHDKLMKEKELLEAEVLRLKCELNSKEKAMKLELEEPVQQERTIYPDVSHVREVEQSACTQQKEKDGSCFTAAADDTSCDAASGVDNLDSPVSRSTHHEDHQSSFSLVYYPGSETAIIQTETLDLLNDVNILPDFYDARMISTGLRSGIKAELDVFSEEVESTTGFIPFDWWEAN